MHYRIAHIVHDKTKEATSTRKQKEYILWEDNMMLIELVEDLELSWLF